jgi:hypothetical protein
MNCKSLCFISCSSLFHQNVMLKGIRALRSAARYPLGPQQL